MATIQISDTKKYVKAIGLLHRLGGMFRTKPTRQLIVDPGQLRALREAGLITQSNGEPNNGEKES